MPTQAVRINPNGTVVETKVTVRKSQHEDVRWIALLGGGPWKITFDKDANGSPFSMTEYTVGPGGSEGSTGGPVGGVVGKTYKYNVRNAVNNQITDDPDVDVE
ncbi:MAG TPA: hypothetical protein VIK60_03240 [Vicinamibacterales bacterium]